MLEKSYVNIDLLQIRCRVSRIEGKIVDEPAAREWLVRQGLQPGRDGRWIGSLYDIEQLRQRQVITREAC